MTLSANNKTSQQALDDDLFSLAPRHPDSRLETDWLFLYNKLPPDQWFGADYAYKTSGWLKVHTNIRKRQRILVQISEAYISGEFDWSEYRSQILKRINMHVLKLHQHHEVEDKALAEELHKTLVAVTDLLQQHLTDEEDLVIPILGLRQW